MPGRSSRRARLGPLLAALFLAACAGATHRTAAADRAVLHISCPVADAVLWVDGRHVAQLRDLRGGVVLPPGHHQIELRHEDYHAHYDEIDLRPGQRLHLALELAEALP